MNKPYEKDIEREIVESCKKEGAWAIKFVSPRQRHLPDRIILAPGSRLLFLEIKRPGEMPTAAQRYVLRRLIELGFDARWTDDPERVRKWLNYEISCRALPTSGDPFYL